MRRSLPILLRDIKLASKRFRACFRWLWNDRQVRIQRNRFRSARHRMIVIAAANRLQQDRAPATFDHDVERQFAGSAFANLPAPAKSPSPSKSIVAPMSPTTQRFDHSPFRRRKSMSFVRSRNIKVIVFWVFPMARGLSGRRRTSLIDVAEPYRCAIPG
jgi:hypothetical protein